MKEKNKKKPTALGPSPTHPLGHRHCAALLRRPTVGKNTPESDLKKKKTVVHPKWTFTCNVLKKSWRMKRPGCSSFSRRPLFWCCCRSVSLQNLVQTVKPLKGSRNKLGFFFFLFFFIWGSLVYYALQGNNFNGPQKNRGVWAITGHRRDELVLMGLQIHGNTTVTTASPALWFSAKYTQRWFHPTCLHWLHSLFGNSWIGE